MLKPAGVTLVELLVALMLTGLIFGSATVSFLRQQQTHNAVRMTTGADVQMSEAMAIVNAQLSTIDRGADLVAGETRDTAVQFRAPIGFTVACGTSTGTITLARDSSTMPLVALSSAPKPGDSLWWRSDTAWSGTLITSVSAASGPCASPMQWMRADVRLGITAPDTITVGAPIRISRQTRYSFYKASDGTWQLGFREATGTPPRFAAPQPVIGPIVLGSGPRRSSFRYFDSTGLELVPGAAAAGVARIRITTYALVPGQVWWRDSLRADSLDIALQHARGP